MLWCRCSQNICLGHEKALSDTAVGEAVAKDTIRSGHPSSTAYSTPATRSVTSAVPHSPESVLANAYPYEVDPRKEHPAARLLAMLDNVLVYRETPQMLDESRQKLPTPTKSRLAQPATAPRAVPLLGAMRKFRPLSSKSGEIREGQSESYGG
jgi:hypothetical protein